MQEFNIEIEIDEDGNIKAESKGIKGELCVTELNDILKGLEGDESFKNKPEYYQKIKSIKQTVRNNS